MNTDLCAYENDDSLRIIYKGKTRISVFRLFPGILLGFNQVETAELPAAPFRAFFRSEVVLRINFSLSGICEIRTEKEDYIYVKGSTMSVSTDTASRVFSYPTGFYKGIELYIQKEAMEKIPEGLDPFGIDFSKITSAYLSHHSTFSAQIRNEYMLPIQAIEELVLQESPDISQMRLHALLILRMLSSGAAALTPVPTSVLTLRQMECAKAAREILASHISKRTTILEVADQLNVGESSLKNWFRAVYGKSISVYMRDLRIQMSKRLLLNSDLSIFEIAGLAGYENQAKFTAMFHKYCGYTPSFYRRMHTHPISPE